MGEIDTEKIYAFDLDVEDWEKLLEERLGEKKFRAKQICDWIWKKRVFSFEEMTNLSKELRARLADIVDVNPPEAERREKSKIDRTEKLLWRLRDGDSVESVLISGGGRTTACISTQVGCPLGCAFCATGLSGYVRNLSAGEIAAQFIAMEKICGRDINNVVYMGMGEPFLNTDNVLKSIRLLNGERTRNLGIRHITVSTAGVAHGIEKFARDGGGARLAISLHAANDALRSSLMPVNRSYPLAELRTAMQSYQKKTGDRISIEYVLLGGVNDGVAQARELVRYMRGIHAFINLIPYNSTDGSFKKPDPESILRFRSVLESAGFESEIRKEQGADINAACGQLRRKSIRGIPASQAEKEERGATARRKRGGQRHEK
jgi:23S rRNA (adenine2503-C2)-methyltransferase